MIIRGCVHPDDIEQHWGWVEPLIDAALKRNDYRYKIEHVKSAILNASMHLWIWEDSETEAKSALVSKVFEYPDRKSLILLYCGGKHYQAWVNSLSLVLDYAKATGCSEVEMYGRKGWERLLKRYGFKIDAYVMRCKLK